MDCYLHLKYCRRQYTLLFPTQTKRLTKFNPKMLYFKSVLDLNSKHKEGLNNLIFSIGFQMALNMFNGVKTAFLFKKLQKIAQRLGAARVRSCKSGRAFRVGFGPKVDKNFGLNSGLRRSFCFRCTKT